MKKYYLTLFFSILFFNLACQTNKTVKLNEAKSDKRQVKKAPQCQHQATSKPSWVDGNHFDLDGFDVAVASAPVRQELTYKKARTNALKKLREQIQTQVISSVELNTSIQNEAVDKEYNESIKTYSKLNLNDVQEFGQWLDAKNCLAWVRVAIRKETAREFALLQTAEDHYQTAKNQQISIKERYQSIENSLLIYKKIKFELLDKKPPQLYFVEKANKIKDALAQQIKAKKNVILIINNPNLNADHHLQIHAKLDQLLGIQSQNYFLYHQPCNTQKQCIQKAINDYAEKLILLQLETSIREASSTGYLATLSLGVQEHNLRGNQDKIVKRLLFKGSEFTLYRDEIKWNEAIQNLKKITQTQN